MVRKACPEDERSVHFAQVVVVELSTFQCSPLEVICCFDSQPPEPNFARRFVSSNAGSVEGESIADFRWTLCTRI